MYVATFQIEFLTEQNTIVTKATLLLTAYTLCPFDLPIQGII